MKRASESKHAPHATREYGDPIVSANLSKRSTLQTCGAFSLVKGTNGYEPAGSAARWTDSYYSVETRIDGARHARRYSSLDQACEHFARTKVKS